MSHWEEGPVQTHYTLISEVAWEHLGLPPDKLGGLSFSG